jgi:hypothetical protein
VGELEGLDTATDRRGAGGGQGIGFPIASRTSKRPVGFGGGGAFKTLPISSRTSKYSTPVLGCGTDEVDDDFLGATILPLDGTTADDFSFEDLS